jgi:HlyD family secretion protein
MALILKILKYSAFVALLGVVTGCQAVDTLMAQEDKPGIQASGMVEAVEVDIGPEISGRVTEVLVSEGDSVSSGELLFALEGKLLQAQHQEAQAALESARAGLATAQAGKKTAESALAMAKIGLDMAQIQYDIELSAARAANQSERTQVWNEEAPSEFSLPAWYFTSSEDFLAAQTEVEKSREAFDIEMKNYQQVIQDSSNADLSDLESQLADARADFHIANQLRERDITQNGRQEIDDVVESYYQAAKAELESVQEAYDQMLPEGSAQDVLEARSRVSVARQRYESALDYLDSLRTGDRALRVQAAAISNDQAQAQVGQAEANLAQAETMVTQAETALPQAQARLDSIAVQLEKLDVNSPVSGVVMTRAIQPGEVVQPGASAISIGLLDNLTVTVYIPEDLYGQIELEQRAMLTADSFPGRSFEAHVTRIADQAEFTPRNVQTEKDRRTTVFAVELAVDDPQGMLKPGMPVDVDFGAG